MESPNSITASTTFKGKGTDEAEKKKRIFDDERANLVLKSMGIKKTEAK